MLGVARSLATKLVPPDRWAMNWAVSGRICISPSAPAEDCRCRKPAPTLLQRASLELGIALPASIMVGDSRSDVEAARAAGCRPVLISDSELADPDVLAVKDLPAAVALWRDLSAVGAAPC